MNSLDVAEAKLEICKKLSKGIDKITLYNNILFILKNSVNNEQAALALCDSVNEYFNQKINEIGLNVEDDLNPSPVATDTTKSKKMFRRIQ